MSRVEPPVESVETWRDLYGVHPAAEVFPLMSDAELRDLGEDIRKNGLREPVTLWVKRRSGESLRVRDEPVVLDGRNRLDAMELVGLRTFINRAGGTSRNLLPSQATTKPAGHNPAETRVRLLEGGDPIAFVTSLNARRRHLSRAQKRDAIAALLKLAPERSDRQVAKDVGADHKTVGDVRKKSEAGGEIPHVDERAGADGKTYTRSESASEPGPAPTPAPEPAEPEGWTPEHSEAVAYLDGVREALLAATGNISETCDFPVEELEHLEELRQEIGENLDWLKDLLDNKRDESLGLADGEPS